MHSHRLMQDYNASRTSCEGQCCLTPSLPHTRALDIAQADDKARTLPSSANDPRRSIHRAVRSRFRLTPTKATPNKAPPTKSPKTPFQQKVLNKTLKPMKFRVQYINDSGAGKPVYSDRALKEAGIDPKLWQQFLTLSKHPMISRQVTAWRKLPLHLPSPVSF